MTNAIETFALTKRFPKPVGLRGLLTRTTAEFPAVKSVNLSVREGELFGLLGPNGAGKTTLIKMLTTLIQPTSGSAQVNGYDLSQEKAIKSTIGLSTSDERSFFGRLSGQQNLEFFSSLYGLPPQEIRQRVQVVLEQVGLMAQANQGFQTYSTGMKQRLSIARALLNRPRVLFLDEPSKGLDPLATRQLHDLILQLSRQGITIFLTTHHLEEAQALCQRIAILHQGHILACGTLAELRQHAVFSTAFDSSGKPGLSGHYLIQVHHLTPSASAQLRQEIPGLDIHTSMQAEQPEGSPGIIRDANGQGSELVTAAITELRFPSIQESGTLNQVLQRLVQEEASIQSIAYQEASLEDIFTHLVHNDLDQATEQTSVDYYQYPQENQDKNTKTPPSSLEKPTTNAVKNTSKHFALQIPLAFLKRDWLIESSYRVSMILQIATIFITVGVYFFIAKLLGTAATPYLASYGGNYFAFVLIGVAFSGYFGVGLSSFASNLRLAQTTGTLEAMLSTPTSLSTIILSSSLWNYLFTTFQALVYLSIGGLFLDLDLSRGNYPAALVILLLTIIVFSSVGVLSASFIMVLKRGDPITWLFGAVSGLLGGVYYPLEILPDWMQRLAHLLPITYALQAMRQALLQGASFDALLPDILALSAFAVLLLPASLWAFRYAVFRAKIDGSLSHY